MDSHLEGKFSTEDARIVVNLASQCLQYEPKERPSTKDLLSTLGPLQQPKCDVRNWNCLPQFFLLLPVFGLKKKFLHFIRFHLMSCLEFRSTRKLRLSQSVLYLQWERPVQGWISRQSIRFWSWHTIGTMKELTRYSDSFHKHLPTFEYSEWMLQTNKCSYLFKNGRNKWKKCSKQGSEETLHFAIQSLKQHWTSIRR